MKRIFRVAIFLVAMCTIVLNVWAIESKEIVQYDDVNTLNFISKFGHLELSSIEKICSYDYCELRSGSSFREAINHFTKNYLKTIKDEEIRASLRVKGIKITDVVFAK